MRANYFCLLRAVLQNHVRKIGKIEIGLKKQFSDFHTFNIDADILIRQ